MWSSKNHSSFSQVLGNFDIDVSITNDDSIIYIWNGWIGGYRLYYHQFEDQNCICLNHSCDTLFFQKIPRANCWLFFILLEDTAYSDILSKHSMPINRSFGMERSLNMCHLVENWHVRTGFATFPKRHLLRRMTLRSIGGEACLPALTLTVT